MIVKKQKNKESINKARHELRKTLYEREAVSIVVDNTVKAIQNVYIGF